MSCVSQGLSSEGREGVTTGPGMGRHRSKIQYEGEDREVKRKPTGRGERGQRKEEGKGRCAEGE
eukprot:228063-Pleurochrysis_carterae.AAC.2